MNTRPFLVQNEANFTLFKIPFEKYNEKLSLSNNFFKYEKTKIDDLKKCCSFFLSFIIPRNYSTVGRIQDPDLIQDLSMDLKPEKSHLCVWIQIPNSSR